MPKTVLYSAAGMLLLAILPLPYGYYTLLRLVATIVFGWAALISYRREAASITWVYALAALLFNPLIPVELSKTLWVPLDLAAALLLILTRERLMEPDGETTRSGEAHELSADDPDRPPG